MNQSFLRTVVSLVGVGLLTAALSGCASDRRQATRIAPANGTTAAAKQDAAAVPATQSAQQSEVAMTTSTNASQAQDQTGAYPCWRYETMRPVDLKRAIEERAIAYMVVSPLEWHGEAMAFGCDPFVGTATAERAWKKTGGVMIPTLYLGAETAYKAWTEKGLTDYWALENISKEHHPGSLYLTPMTLELVLREMVSFVEREGFKVCVVVTGHGATEHMIVLRELEKRWKDRPMTLIATSAWGRGRPQDLQFEGSGGHADFAEASVLGGVDAKYVDKSVFGSAPRDQKIEIKPENADKIDFEKGRRIIEFAGDQLAERVNKAYAEGKPAGEVSR